MADLKKKTDTEVIQLALQNQEAFAEIVIRYEKKLLRYIRRFTGLNKESAEDVLQEAFIKIYRNLNAFDQSLKFSSWAYRITHNEAVNYLRKNKKKETLSLESDSEDETSLIEVLRSDADVKDEVLKKELKKNVRKLIHRLPNHYREVLVLRYLEDLDYAEISHVLKKPIGTVSTLLSRAKENFKKLAIKNHLNE